MAALGSTLLLAACLGISDVTEDDAGACGPGKADCDNDGSNGCETTLATNKQHCGTCGNACLNVPGATVACSKGACEVSCSGAFRDCDLDPSNKCETDINQSLENCGACGSECKGEHASSTKCVEGNCAFSCDSGFSDCDGDPGNGCETELTKDVASCGACGTACPKSDAGAQIPCTAGQCRFLASCKELVGSGAPSGVYSLASANAPPYQAYCNMDADGGGWTLLLKANGKLKTFEWGSSLWTNATPLNETSPAPPPGNDHSKFTEAKLAGYASLPFAELRFETWDPRDSKLRAVKVGKSAPSLLSAVQNGSATSVNKNDWLSLMAQPLYHQDLCNLQGFSRSVSGAAVRLGLIMNEPNTGDANSCSTPDTAVGIGLAQYGISCGNYAGGLVDKVIPKMPSSPQVLPAYCYLYVR